MTEIIHADIFFFITSVVTVALGIFGCIVLYYIIKILQSIRAIVARIDAGSDMIAEDIQAARDFVATGGLISHLISFATRASGGRKARSSNKSKKELSINHPLT